MSARPIKVTRLIVNRKFSGFYHGCAIVRYIKKSKIKITTKNISCTFNEGEYLCVEL